MKSVLFMDIAIAFVGIYLSIVAVLMKKGGKISPLIVSEQEIKKCKKPVEFIAAIFPVMFAFGLISFVVGVIGVLCDTRVLSIGRIWGIMELGVFLIALAGFAYQLKMARKHYM